MVKRAGENTGGGYLKGVKVGVVIVKAKDAGLQSREL